MEKQTLVELKTILNLQNPDFDNSLTDLPDQDKIKLEETESTDYEFVDIVTSRLQLKLVVH